MSLAILIVLIACTLMSNDCFAYSPIFGHKNSLTTSKQKHLSPMKSFLSMSTASIRPAEDTRRAKIPLNIAVAGGGIGGIFVANAMKIRGFNVTVFEKSAKFSRFGGPIQLASKTTYVLNILFSRLNTDKCLAHQAPHISHVYIYSI